MNHIQLTMGATTRPIKAQLKEQGFTATTSDFAYWQRCADALCFLSIRRLISKREVQNGRNRLVKLIAKDCKPI